MPALSALAGFVALAAAFAPPLERLAATSLSAHMVQHLVIQLAAAPLFALACAHTRWPARVPAVPALLAYVAVTWSWHLPAAYDTALASLPVHVLMHVSMLGTATLFWLVVVRSGRRGPAGYVTGLGMVFVAATQHAGLGALLLFARAPLYAIGTLEDQQVAAAVMKTPSIVVYTVALAALLLAWLGNPRPEVTAELPDPP